VFALKPKSGLAMLDPILPIALKQIPINIKLLPLAMPFIILPIPLIRLSSNKGHQTLSMALSLVPLTAVRVTWGVGVSAFALGLRGFLWAAVGWVLGGKGLQVTLLGGFLGGALGWVLQFVFLLLLHG
jgi:hypothetical protein